MDGTVEGKLVTEKWPVLERDVDTLQHQMNGGSSLSMLADPFDTAPMARGCWQTCQRGASSNGNNYMDRVDQALFPIYRDPDTLGQYLASAKQFSCVDLCEKDFLGKRINFLLLIAFCGKQKYRRSAPKCTYYSVPNKRTP